MADALQTILYIDDEQDILEVAKMSLELVGNYTIHTHTESDKAVELATSLQPQLIMLDVMMPMQDGPATLGLLKNNPDTAAIPVIFMTARVQPSEIEHYRQMGVVDVLPKPFDPMQLPRDIARIWHQANQAA